MIRDETASRAAGDGFYLEDLTVGQRFATGTCTVSQQQIVDFATQFDPQPFHVDEELAKGSVFRGLAASGWHTGSLGMRLLVDGGLPIAGGLVAVNVELSWPAPVRPEDVLRVEGEVMAITPSKSRQDRGIVTMRGETRNQTGQVVQIMTVKLIVPRRPHS